LSLITIGYGQLAEEFLQRLKIRQKAATGANAEKQQRHQW